ncbi:MAG: outer membrane protein assembly factor BamC [Pseudomonadales bacterium]
MNRTTHVILIIVTLFIGSCSWIGITDRSDRYLEAESIDRVEIPEPLDRPNFTDVMGVPRVTDPRGLQGQKPDVGLPEALGASVEVDQIVIKKLGDTRWVFLDVPPASVWPRVQEFFEANNLLIQSADPSRGIIETQWLTSSEGDGEEMFTSMTESLSWTDAGQRVQNKFRLQIEPGIRPDSSEIHIEHARMGEGAPYRRDNIEWDSKSDNIEVEQELLTELAHYLGETINQGQSVSLLAGSVQGSPRAQLVPDAQKPVLKYKLPFNRAWATVGAALEDARISVEDLDRASSIYYVVYDNSRVEQPGFLRRLFSNEDEEVSEANRYMVHLDTMPGDEVHVTVKKDQETSADPLVAERLLQIIKEYST